MDRKRLFDVRTSRLPELIGRCATNIAEIAGMVNEAQERLLLDPLTPDEGWWGGWARYAFTVAAPHAYILTPREVSRIILADVCKKPITIRNQWYEFLNYGKGYMPSGCNTDCGQDFAAYERETVPTLDTFVAGSTVRVYYDDSRDVGKRVLIQGTDTNDKVVRGISTLTGQPILGETIVLASPFTDTVTSFNTLTGIQKDPTYGDITLKQVDSNGVESDLSMLEPNELTGQYRKYLVNGLDNKCCGAANQQMLAMCKLDFIPVQSDSDYLLIQCVPALIEECMAVRYSGMDTPGAAQLAQQRHANALRLLSGQLDHYLGKERPAIRRSLFGSNTLRRQPV